MIGCLWACVRKQPIIVLYFECENELKFYNREARSAIQGHHSYKWLSDSFWWSVVERVCWKGAVYRWKYDSHNNIYETLFK